MEHIVNPRHIVKTSLGVKARRPRPRPRLPASSVSSDIDIYKGRPSAESRGHAVPNPPDDPDQAGKQQAPAGREHHSADTQARGGAPVKSRTGSGGGGQRPQTRFQ